MLYESLIDSKQFKTCKCYLEIVLIGRTFLLTLPMMLHAKKVISVSLIEAYGFCSQLADSSFRHVKGLGKILESKSNYESTLRDGILGVLQSDLYASTSYLQLAQRKISDLVFLCPFEIMKSKHCIFGATYQLQAK